MITNHTRVECRVLCALARGGQVREVREGVYDTGAKRNAQGQTRAEFVQAGGDKGEFRGVRVTFAQDLFDRLQAAGYITEAGNISKAGREYLMEVRHRAAEVIAGEEDPDKSTAEVVTEQGFARPGLSVRDCCRSARSMASVIDRLSPEEV